MSLGDKVSIMSPEDVKTDFLDMLKSVQNLY